MEFLLLLLLLLVVPCDIMDFNNIIIIISWDLWYNGISSYYLIQQKFKNLLSDGLYFHRD